jgi:septum formation protein
VTQVVSSLSARHLVLASASASRAAILRQAGIMFDVRVSGVDEDAIKADHSGSDADLVLALARAKAQAVPLSEDEIVLGADQIMVCDGKRYDKPASLAVARQTLQSLSGRTHYLVNGVSLCTRDGEIWSYSNQIALTVRELSETFLDAYLAQEGERILSSVGCYRLEAFGAHLFTEIAGDYFSILGLPLLPLLQELRRLAVVPS